MSDANELKMDERWRFSEAWPRDLSSALEKVKSGGGKLPSERFNELAKEYAEAIEAGRLDGSDPLAITFEALFKVLDERLGRAP